MKIISYIQVLIDVGESKFSFSILGGFMVSPRSSFTGQDVSYLYPDCRTALVGDFGPDGKMVEARLGEVIGTTASNDVECSCCKELAVIDPRFHISSSSEVIFKCKK